MMLWGAESVARIDEKYRVFAVRGEKNWKILAETMPLNPVVGWDGEPSDYDWTSVAGRKVLVWLSADDEDKHISSIAADRCRALDCEAGIINMATDAANMERREIPPELKRMVDHAIAWSNPVPSPPAKPDEEKEGSPLASVDSGGLPVAIGMRDNNCVLIDRRGPQLVEYAREAMGRKTLMHLADLEDWQQSTYAKPPKDDRIEVEWDKAASHYVATCMKAGPVSADKVRGLGVYRDGGRIVANLARDGLLVDGKLKSIREHQSRYIYIAQSTTVPMTRAMTYRESRDIVALIEALRWKHPFYAKMFIGWLAMAPVCGALVWRPSCWITGPSGCGKTTVLELVVRQLIGPIAFMTSQSTTEAGIRQENSGKSIPVVWDEFEAETRADDGKRKAVLELVRAATSGDGTIVKGTPGGGSKRFSVRLAFLFASINASLQMRADLSRTFLVELRGPASSEAERAKDAKAFAAWKKAVTSWPDDVGLHWIWRAVEECPSAIESIKILSKLLLIFTDQRTTDQVAPMLAFYWSAKNDGIITEDAAKEFIGEFADWFEFSDSLQAADGEETDQADERNLIRALMDSVLNIRFEENSGEISIRELVARAKNTLRGEAQNALVRYGMRVIAADKGAAGTHLMISRRHEQIARLLAKTPWSTGWNEVLKRTEGAITGRDLSPREFMVDGEKRLERGTAVPLTFCDLDRVATV